MTLYGKDSKDSPEKQKNFIAITISTAVVISLFSAAIFYKKIFNSSSREPFSKSESLLKESSQRKPPLVVVTHDYGNLLEDETAKQEYKRSVASSVFVLGKLAAYRSEFPDMNADTISEIDAMLVANESNINLFKEEYINGQKDVIDEIVFMEKRPETRMIRKNKDGRDIKHSVDWLIDQHKFQDQWLREIENDILLNKPIAIKKLQEASKSED